VTRRHTLLAVAVLALLFVLAAVQPGAIDDHASAPPPPDRVGRRVLLLGRSVEGRPITAFALGDLDSRYRMLVVGCIHGNEPAGIAVADGLSRVAPPREFALWVVPDLNPDGVAAHSRGNAHGVDLNRNFPWRWRPLRGLFYSGPRPLSEPESRIAAALILRVGPRISIWFHQQMSLVDESGGRVAVERRFAALVGLPLGRLAREPGGVVGWQNHRDPGTTAFVVELPAGALPARAVRRYVAAALAVGA
jgi:protein MpaA